MIFRKWFGRKRLKGMEEAAEMWRIVAEQMVLKAERARVAQGAGGPVREEVGEAREVVEIAQRCCEACPPGRTVCDDCWENMILSWESGIASGPDEMRPIRGFHAYDGAAMCAVVKK